MGDEQQRTHSADEARELVGEGAQLIDVRAPHEWEAGRIPGALHIPLAELSERAGELEPERALIVYCRGDERSSVAAEALSAAGYQVGILAGGIGAWVKAGLELDPSDGYVAESGQAAAILQARRAAGS